VLTVSIARYKTVSDPFSQQIGFTADTITEMYSYTRPVLPTRTPRE